MLKSQFKLMFKSKQFIIALTAMTVYTCLSFIITCLGVYKNDIVAVASANFLVFSSGMVAGIRKFLYELFCLTLPIFAVLPFADNFFVESKGHITDLCVTRKNNNGYFFSKLIVVFFSAFVVIAIPLLLNMALTVLAFPISSTAVPGNRSVFDVNLYTQLVDTIMFKDLFISHPYLYDLFYIGLESLAAGLMAVITYLFSFFYDKSRILLICAVFGAYNFVTLIGTVFGIGEYLLNLYLYPLNFYVGQTETGLIISFAVLIICAIVPIPFAKKRLNDLL